VDEKLIRWLESVPIKIRDRFVKIGLIDANRAAAGKLLCGHIEDFEQSLLDKGDTRKQAQMTVSRVQRIVRDCKFTVWTDITASRVQRCVAKLHEDGLSRN